MAMFEGMYTPAGMEDEFARRAAEEALRRMRATQANFEKTGNWGDPDSGVRQGPQAQPRPTRPTAGMTPEEAARYNASPEGQATARAAAAERARAAGIGSKATPGVTPQSAIEAAGPATLKESSYNAGKAFGQGVRRVAGSGAVPAGLVGGMEFLMPRNQEFFNDSNVPTSQKLRQFGREAVKETVGVGLGALGAGAGSAVLPFVGTAAGAVGGYMAGNRGANAALNAVLGESPADAYERKMRAEGREPQLLNRSLFGDEDGGQKAPAAPAGGNQTAATEQRTGLRLNSQGRSLTNDPRREDMDPTRASLGASRDMTPELNTAPRDLPSDLQKGVIYKTVDPKTGRVTYSGMDVKGDARFVDGMGRNIDPRGSVSGANPVTQAGAQGAGTAGQPTQAGLRAPIGPSNENSVAVSQAVQAAAARGDFDAVRNYYQSNGGTWQGKTGEQTAAENRQFDMDNQRRMANETLRRTLPANATQAQALALKMEQDGAKSILAGIGDQDKVAADREQAKAQLEAAKASGASKAQLEMLKLQLEQRDKLDTRRTANAKLLEDMIKERAQRTTIDKKDGKPITYFDANYASELRKQYTDRLRDLATKQGADFRDLDPSAVMGEQKGVDVQLGVRDRVNQAISENMSNGRVSSSMISPQQIAGQRTMRMTDLIRSDAAADFGDVFQSMYKNGDYNTMVAVRGEDGAIQWIPKTRFTRRSDGNPDGDVLRQYPQLNTNK